MTQQAMPAPPVTDTPVAKVAERAQRRNRRRGPGYLYYLGIAVIVVYCLAPFYWMVVSALRRPSDQFSNSFIPDPMSWANLKAAFSPLLMPVRRSSTSFRRRACAAPIRRT